jgi:cell division transport system permease protein
MTFIDIRRIIKAGSKNFVRNTFVSLSSVLVVTITLSVVVGVWFSQAILDFSLENLKDKVDVTVYFEPDTTETRILDLQNRLNERSDVSETEYVSAEEALVDFRERHKNDQTTIDALNELGVNPLGAQINIRAEQAEQYENIADFLEDERINQTTIGQDIDKINFFQNEQVINRLIDVSNDAKNLGLWAMAILIAISIIITLNTIRLAIYISREEIQVMQLVGAGKKYVRGPFVVEGILYGLVASIITAILYLPITSWLGNNMTAFLELNLHDYFLENFFQIFILLTVSGVVLGAVASMLAVRKYLNK